ncbi:MAG: S-adenosylmethionine:tRNA ribosyltransferase-isomerase [Chitinophagaceae bacterium]|nr:S-adenosylmethionine:tRNA ribosyltransferase-isomerase [Chitinophagaceae bacterium]
MDPRQLKIQDFTYDLPEERIAVYPLANRDASKLLIYRQGQIRQDIYRNIARHLPEGALLVFNDTRVIAARLLFQKSTGGTIEVFCLAPHPRYPDIATAMLQKKKVWWVCLIGGASKWKHGTVLEKKMELGTETVLLKASVIERLADSFTIELEWEPQELSFAELLHCAGVIPLPPYIKRAAETSDAERYQTIYARHEGSVAAPTAGLHFTDPVFRSLREAQIEQAFVTLHVGAGTFKPVKAEQMQDHIMHEEYMDVRYDTIERLAEKPGKIFCVGTTSLRTVESLFWMGVKILRDPGLNIDDLVVRQWEWYETPEMSDIAPDTALAALLKWMKQKGMSRLICPTRILIAPGYRFGMTSGLITNFHQPRSTLLLLVAALIGRDWKQVYDYALEHDFRFLSYGDGCLLYISQDRGE